jgi:hypothetical protein
MNTILIKMASLLLVIMTVALGSLAGVEELSLSGARVVVERGESVLGSAEMIAKDVGVVFSEADIVRVKAVKIDEMKFLEFHLSPQAALKAIAFSGNSKEADIYFVISWGSINVALSKIVVPIENRDGVVLVGVHPVVDAVWMQEMFNQRKKAGGNR